MTDQKPNLESAIYAGAIATLIVGLLPYVSVVMFPAYVIGAVVAVRHAVVKKGQTLTLGRGAKLGFYTTMLGTAAAVVVFDLVWALFDYQLWQTQNSSLMMTLLGGMMGEESRAAMEAGMAEQAAKGFAWYMPILQMIGSAIFSGIFAVPTGMIAAKVFGKGNARPDSA